MAGTKQKQSKSEQVGVNMDERTGIPCVGTYAKACIQVVCVY